MNVTTISVTYSRKFNLGDYNSAQIEYTCWAQLEPGDFLSECNSELWEMAKANVRAQALPLLKTEQAAMAEIKKIFLGLPMDEKFEKAAEAKLDNQPITQLPDPTPGKGKTLSRQQWEAENLESVPS